MNIYDNGVLVREAIPVNGVSSFIQFNGVVGSLMIYLKLFAILFLATFLICSVNDIIKSKFEPKL